MLCRVRVLTVCLFSLPRARPQVMYLRRFRNLKLLNLAGNPISKNPEYKNYVLSHTLALKFLDCRLVDQASVQAAKEQYQDEMLELQEREEGEAGEEAARLEKVRRERELAAANLAGIEGLFDTLLAVRATFCSIRRSNTQLSTRCPKITPSPPALLITPDPPFPRVWTDHSASAGGPGAGQAEPGAQPAGWHRRHARQLGAPGPRISAATSASVALPVLCALFQLAVTSPRLCHCFPPPNKINATTEFVEKLKTEHKLKEAEHVMWKEALDTLISAREAESREVIAVYDRQFRHLHGNAMGSLREGQEELLSQAVTALRKLRNEDTDELQDKLMVVESSTVDAIGELVTEFDRNYTEMVDGSRGTISAFFTQVRDLENGNYDRVMQQVAQLIERATATAEAEDGGGFSDDARQVLSDKEGLNNSLQASHDAHLSLIDGSEDRLVSEEVRRYTTLLTETRAWENTRNRDRISEIMGLVERWRDRVDGVLSELEAATNSA